jgi:hypothetical protein
MMVYSTHYTPTLLWRWISYADFWNKYLDISGWIRFNWYIYIVEMFNIFNLQLF